MKQILAITMTLAALASCTDNGTTEIPLSPGAILDVPVGGPDQPNQVYIHLMADKLTSINRSQWDLGFYSGTDHKVILNAASEVMAREIPKSDLDDIVPKDYEGFNGQTNVDAVFSNLFSPPPYPDWFNESSNWIDEPNGDLSKTAINLSEGHIYYIHRGFTPGKEYRGEYLVKISIQGDSYQIEYIIPGSTEIKSLTINKDVASNYTYFNFDTGVTQIAPDKELWDIAFTTYMEKLDIGGGIKIPYRFQDYVIQNRNGVQVAIIEIDETSDLLDEYENFNQELIAGLTFLSDVNSIGSTWRTVASPAPGSVTGVREDRFYIIRDVNGNNYKLLFTQMLSETGERGFPQITYELL